MRTMKALGAVAALTLWAGQAWATPQTFNLSLTGVTSNTTFGAFDCCGAHFDTGSLTLSGLDAGNAITVSQGDTIKATIIFDTPFTVPASVDLTDLEFDLSGSLFPNEDTGVFGSTTLSLGGVAFTSNSFTTTTSSQLALGDLFFQPNNVPLTFDRIDISFLINTLATPATLDGASFGYDLVTNDPVAVPEPGTWALMLLGFGGLGAALRTRRGRLTAA